MARASQQSARTTAILRILRPRRPLDDDTDAEPGEFPVRSPEPAVVVRDGLIFCAQCPVCPWEADGRFLHVEAAIDAAQHNTSIHPGWQSEDATLECP